MPRAVNTEATEAVLTLYLLCPKKEAFNCLLHLRPVIGIECEAGLYRDDSIDVEGQLDLRGSASKRKVEPHGLGGATVILPGTPNALLQNKSQLEWINGFPRVQEKLCHEAASPVCSSPRWGMDVGLERAGMWSPPCISSGLPGKTRARQSSCKLIFPPALKDESASQRSRQSSEQ